MLLAAPVLAERRVTVEPLDDPADLEAAVSQVRSEIPAVTHVNGSARVQTVDAEVNPEFAGLLRAFDDLTGCPVLLNTSFNHRDEPIVCTPDDAYRTFRRTGLDVLVLEDFVIESDSPAAATTPVVAHAAPVARAAKAVAPSFAATAAISSDTDDKQRGSVSSTSVAPDQTESPPGPSPTVGDAPRLAGRYFLWWVSMLPPMWVWWDVADQERGYRAWLPLVAAVVVSLAVRHQRAAIVVTVASAAWLVAAGGPHLGPAAVFSTLVLGLVWGAALGTIRSVWRPDLIPRPGLLVPAVVATLVADVLMFVDPQEHAGFVDALLVAVALALVALAEGDRMARLMRRFEPLQDLVARIGGPVWNGYLTAAERFAVARNAWWHGVGWPDATIEVEEARPPWWRLRGYLTPVALWIATWFVMLFVRITNLPGSRTTTGVGRCSGSGTPSSTSTSP